MEFQRGCIFLLLKLELNHELRLSLALPTNKHPSLGSVLLISDKGTLVRQYTKYRIYGQHVNKIFFPNRDHWSV